MSLFQLFQMKIYKRKFVSRLGLMHMIATNLCMWVKVVILETKHEILVSYHGEDDSLNMTQLMHATDNVKCGSDIMQKVLEDSSPFLFPCTIEFSLICAAIQFIMWKNVGREHVHYKQMKQRLLKSSEDSMIEKRHQHYSVDCSHANTGMFCGIIILVITIISLIIFFVFISNTDPHMQNIAVQVVSISELFLYSLTSVAVLIGMFQMKKLWYDISRKLELDNFLLIIAQTGVIIYATFSVVATFFQVI
jgi:succinate dehydrogenase hydrophobic anchor subunit